MRKLIPSLEVIDFQRDDTGSQIEAILYKMLEKLKADKKHQIEYSPEDTELTLYLAKRFGLKADLSYATNPKDYNPNHPLAACIPIRLAPYHVLDDKLAQGKYINDLQKVITHNLNGKTGKINLKTAKVSGIFSELPIQYWMDINRLHFLFKLTVPEITAVLLHETGHIFTYYEFSSRLSRNNQVLQNLANALKTCDKKELEFVFKEITLVNDIDPKTFDDLLNEDNQVIMGFRLFQTYVDIITTGMPNGKYSDTSSEQLADNFAARFGYGKELVSGLDKLSVGSPEKSGIMYGIFVMFQISVLIQLFETIFGVIPLITVLPGLPFAAALTVIKAIARGIRTIILIIKIIRNSGDDTEFVRYDILKRRYIRIRHQCIEGLQYSKMSKEDKQAMIQNIKVIDKLIENTSVYTSVFKIIANFTSYKNRNTKHDIEFQQLLEDLAHNDLFLKSAELSTL